MNERARQFSAPLWIGKKRGGGVIRMPEIPFFGNDNGVKWGGELSGSGNKTGCPPSAGVDRE